MLWNTFRIIGPLCKESAGYIWIPSTQGQVMGYFGDLFVVDLKELFNSQFAGDLGSNGKWNRNFNKWCDSVKVIWSNIWNIADGIMYL